MKEHSALLRHLLIAAAVIQPFFSCSTNIAGGSEIGNPLVVTGMVADSTGRGAENVSLYLVDISENDPQKLFPDSCNKVNSSASGEYLFTDVYEGIYHLIGISLSGQTMFLRTIAISTPQDPTGNGDTITSGIDTLQAAANVVVNVTECAAHSGSFIFIPGTVIRVSVDSCGEYLVRCPASTVDIVLSVNDSLLVLGAALSVTAGEWLDLTGEHFDLPVPQLMSGLVAGSADSVYSFIAGEITLGPNHPVAYMFDWGDSASEWSLSNKGSHAWSAPGNFSVRVRARSVRDTLSVSEWSSAAGVTIQ